MSEEIAKILVDIGSVNFSFKKYFTLTSGLKSPVYVDCRKIISFTKERDFIISKAIEYLDQNNINCEIIAGGETAGIPYAAFLSQNLKKPMVYIRKKTKGFGINKQIEGEFKKNQSTLLVEDLATDGGSKVTFVNAIREAGLKVQDIFVIFYYDIFDFKKSDLYKLDLKIHSLCTWKDIVIFLEKNNIYNNAEIKSLKEFLIDPDKWRKKNA
ncbi:orotate phosphoribosyltransferase [Pelagibacteraceae bacterium]|nr:orotate phosphoribosyltransferase [Pelagibacteraceae bacterium]